MPLLSLQGVSCSRTAPDSTPVQVLHRVSLEIPSHTCVSILGPSGSGKTTLLRLIAGLESASEGALLLDGNDLTRTPPEQRPVALLFQGLALYPHLAVRDNLTLGARLRRLPASEIASRYSELTRTLEIADLADRRPDSLSGGEAQRVALARALMLRPRLLLLDEPLSHLDPTLRDKLLPLLGSLPERFGTSVLHVTHDPDEALLLAHHAAILHEGHLLQSGSPSSLYDAPEHLIVARSLGRPPINLVPGRFEGRPGQFRWFDDSRSLELDTTPPDPPPAPGARSILGLRPERIQLRPAAGRTTAIVSRVTFLGAFHRIEFQLERLTLHALVLHIHAGIPAPVFQPGDPLEATFPPDACLLFDATSGRRLRVTATHVSGTPTTTHP